MYDCNWAVIVPMANEGEDFDHYIAEMTSLLDRISSGTVYIVVDKVSTDNTLEMCNALSQRDSRFKTIWAPDNKNVVDAYMRGYREAFEQGHEIIIEMDAGLSHDPKAIPMFIRVLNEGNVCAFGSRFIVGGSMADSPFRRRILSRGGTFLANCLLGTHLHDMTSGYQGFHSHVVAKLLSHNFISTAHFYQTEVRYLLRKHRFAEVPIHYNSPSPRVSKNAIRNALRSLGYFFFRRLSGNPATID